MAQPKDSDPDELQPEASSSFKSNTLIKTFAPILGILIGLNLLLWTIALIIFRPYPLLYGTCLLSWILGLRHAVDADHICAIDNVTRKLVQEGQNAILVGFWFSCGKSNET